MLNFSSNSLFYESYSEAPTVTLQRLKSITTGSFPIFAEIGNNFDPTHSIQTDNLLLQLKTKGKIGICGDNTWGSLYNDIIDDPRLFPSFDVGDIHSVDNSVKKNLPSLLKEPNFSLIVGHFLGVDHCSHVYKLDSECVISKIRELDDFLVEQMRNLTENDLFVAMSDHGMTDDGAHGGSSKEETSSFLYAYSKSIKLEQKTRKINQIDICPTLSALIGIPIPYSNCGTIIDDFFHSKDNRTTARLLNSKQLRTLLNSEGIFDEIPTDEILEAAPKILREKWSTFNLWQMSFGLLSILISFLFFPKPSSFLPFLHALSQLSDSFLFTERLATHFFSQLANPSLLTRFLLSFTRCREDWHQRVCSPTLYLRTPLDGVSFFKIFGDGYIIPTLLFLFSAIRSKGNASSLYFKAILGFFATGHQFTFGGLRVESGFAFGTYNRLVSPLCVIANTFLPFIACDLMVKDPFELLLYQTTSLTSLSLFCYFQRFHLMVWQLFAPRLIFQYAIQIICLAISLFRV